MTRRDVVCIVCDVSVCVVSAGSVCVAVTTTRRIVLMTLIGIDHLETRSPSRLTRLRSHLLTTTNRFLCLFTLFALLSDKSLAHWSAMPLPQWLCAASKKKLKIMFCIFCLSASNFIFLANSDNILNMNLQWTWCEP